MAYNARDRIGLDIANMILCWIFVALRVYVRIFLSKNFWHDDWLAIAANVVHTVSVCFSLDSLINWRLGNGITPKITPDDLKHGLRDQFLASSLYLVSTGIMKLSWGFTLLRLIRSRGQKYFIQAIMVLFAAMSIACLIYFALTCEPARYIWERAVDPYRILLFAGKNPADFGLRPRGHCKSPYATMSLNHAQAAGVLAADLLMGILLPILLLKDLKMHKSQKFTPAVLLSLGATASVATIIRLAYNHTLTDPNVIYTARAVPVWIDLELSWCIIATSLSTLKPLAVKMGILKTPAWQSAPAISATVVQSEEKTRRKFKDDLEWTTTTADREMEDGSQTWAQDSQKGPETEVRSSEAR